MGEWMAASAQTNIVNVLYGVRACAGVYVDYVPCAATPPFPVFIEHCLSLQPWQQKMTNGRTVQMFRLCMRLNDRASFLNRKSNQCQ